VGVVGGVGVDASLVAVADGNDVLVEVGAGAADVDKKAHPFNKIARQTKRRNALEIDFLMRLSPFLVGPLYYKVFEEELSPGF
jgi:hypothetical protein